MTVILAAIAAFVAAVIQRITGLGFVLVLVGPIVLLYGPVEGVTLGVLLALVASLVAIPLVWRQIDWGRSWWLIWPGHRRRALRRAAGAPAARRRAPAPHRGDGVPRAAGGTDLRPLRVADGTHGRRRLGLRRRVHARRERPVGSAARRLRGRRPLAAAQLRGERAADLHRVRRRLRGAARASRLPRRGCRHPRLATIAGIAIGTILSRNVSPRIARAAMLVLAWAGATVVLVRGILALFL